MSRLPPWRIAPRREESRETDETAMQTPLLATDGPSLTPPGSNSFGGTYYKGPRVDGAEVTFKLYALSGRLELPRGASKDEVVKAMKGKVLGARGPCSPCCCAVMAVGCGWCRSDCTRVCASRAYRGHCLARSHPPVRNGGLLFTPRSAPPCTTGKATLAAKV